MKYKMVVMDMDGTLLPKDGVISQNNIKAISAATDKGVKVVICTGRMYISACPLADVFPENISIISSNGAYIRNKDQDKPILERPMKEREMTDIIAICKKYDIGFQLCSCDTVFAEKRLKYYSDLDISHSIYKKLNVVMVEETGWSALTKNNSRRILKSFIMDENTDKLDKLICDVRDMDVELVRMGADCVEIMDKDVNKGKGVEYIAGMYNIDREGIICIGDNENDVSMIKYAGLGVAMGNAGDLVKSHADFVTLSDVDDGVAHVINRFVLDI